MKHALIIVYDGTYPELRMQKTAASVLAEYGIIHDLDHIECHVLNEVEIMQAITAKAITETKTITPDPMEWAASVIFNEFKESILSSDYEEFSTALAIKLAVELMNNTDLVKAVRILSKDETERTMANEIKTKYSLNQRIFQSIRKTLNLVCQGRHIIVR